MITPRFTTIDITYASLFRVVVAALVDEFSAFLDAFPRYQRVLLSELRTVRDLPFFSIFTEGAESVILNPPFDLRSAGSSALDLLVSIFGGVFSVVILVVVSFYLASQEEGIEQFLRMVVPLRDEEYVIDLWERSRAKIGQWLRSQLLLGVVVGILVFIALTLLGVRYALFLALLAAIFELIPVIGPILAAVPAVFFALLSSPVLGLIVAVVYTIIQQLESHVLVPLLMRRVVGLNPLVVVIALLIG